ncbi:MAG: pyridoxal-phosphate dependent enzyme [Spirochaetales bacterium]
MLPEGAPFPSDVLSHRGFSIWRYRECYHLPNTAPSLSLGEGWTPLVKQEVEGKQVYFKLDYLMPSGSFKDRGACVLVSLCKALGIEEIVEDSSGNAGAAIAAYCAAAGIRCRIFAPSYTPDSKLSQTRLLGAEVVKVPGSRQQTNEAVLKAATTTYYASHLWNPFFIQGHASVAFELWEQFRGQLSKQIVLPVGSGGYLEGLFRGLRILQITGLLKQIPRIIGIQSENCSPLQEAFALGLDSTPPVESKPTIAEGIAVSRPPRAAAVLEAVRFTKGTLLAVSEEAILAAHAYLLRLGFFTEPTSAVALAGWLSLPKKERDSSVILLSGHGLKEPEKIAQLQGV